MADPAPSKPNTLETLANKPQMVSADGGRGVGPTLGEDVGAADQEADHIAQQTLKAQMDNAHKPPETGQARGADLAVERTPILPDLATPALTTSGPTPGAPVPPATIDLQNTDQ